MRIASAIVDAIVGELAEKLPCDSMIALVAGLQSVPSEDWSPGLREIEYKLWDQMDDADQEQLKKYKKKHGLSEPN
jgi:hypothetical protein